MNSFVTLCVIVLIYCEVTDAQHGKVATTKKAVISKNTTNAATVAPVTAAAPLATSRPPFLPGFRPCSCAEGQCGCCTGVLLDQFNQKACLNFTYEPDDFALTAAMSMNNKVLYKRTVSGKNPPPMCVRLPRIPFVRLCVEISNIYFASRNIHFCIDMEANWEDITLLEWSFDCVRMGLGGVAVVSPAEGGGIPATPIDSVDQTDEDYDDSARIAPRQPQNFLNNKIIFDNSIASLVHETPRKSLVEVKKLPNGDVVIAARRN